MIDVKAASKMSSYLLNVEWFTPIGAEVGFYIEWLQRKARSTALCIMQKARDAAKIAVDFNQLIYCSFR